MKKLLKSKVFENLPVLPLFSTFYHNECFPLVLLEAMEHGLPCISTTEGGIPGIVDDGKTGFLVPKHDVAVLADKILLLLNDSVLCSTTWARSAGRNLKRSLRWRFLRNA